MFSIGVVGAGQFSRHFIPLFKAHPAVSRVAITDVLPERREEYAQSFGIEAFESFEDMLDSDLDAVAIFTQRHLHGPQAIAALEAGKHVYSAVPMAIDVADIERIVELVGQTRLTYYMAETGVYYPAAVYCRREFAKGSFGDFVYAESQYYHDMDHGFYEAYQHSGGENWQRVAGIPPMLYPTHSTGPIIAATDSYVTKVSCMGYVDKHDDGVFGVGNNDWDNPFSNQVAIQQLANGGIHRALEFRRVGIKKLVSYLGLFLGTEGSYEDAYSQHFYVRDIGGGTMQGTEISALLNSADQEEHRNDPDYVNDVANTKWGSASMAPVLPTHRLPQEFEGIKAIHRGTHKFLAHDFIRAVEAKELPPTHAWRAARITLPGIIAHQSSLQGGTALDVPDFGEPPSGWTVMDMDS